jgi:hypothetical protein
MKIICRAIVLEALKRFFYKNKKNKKKSFLVSSQNITFTPNINISLKATKGGVILLVEEDFLGRKEIHIPEGEKASVIEEGRCLIPVSKKLKEWLENLLLDKNRKIIISTSFQEEKGEKEREFKVITKIEFKAMTNNKKKKELPF